MSKSAKITGMGETEFAFQTVEILLSFVTVVLAVLAVLIALAAIFGFSLFKKKAIYLQGTSIRTMLESAVKDEANILYGDMAESPHHAILSPVTTKEKDNE